MTDAVDFGLLAMYAEDMYSADAPPNSKASLYPDPDPRIAASGWKILAYLTAHDALFPQPGESDRTLSVDQTKRVFYGFLAQNNATPASYAVAIRGTAGLIEWLIDAEFLPISHPRYPQAHVEQGFWGIYQTMNLADPTTGVTTYSDPTEGVAALVGPQGAVVVTGHSLGSALATYFTDDLAVRIGARASACIFASPRTGDMTWAGLFDTHVQSYQLYNYIIDLVPHLPPAGPPDNYATLSKATVLQPDAVQAGICLDILCDHHVLCYCAMIDYAATPTADWGGAQGIGNQPCILGDASTMPEAAKALAVVINAFGIGDNRAIALLKALHPEARITRAPPPVVVAAAAQPPTAPFNPAVPR